MFKHVITGLGVLLLLTAPFASAQAALLAKVEADVDGSGQKKTVELTGDRKIAGSNYYSNLWIMVKNADGKMLTAWKADLDGGYYCLLEKMPVNATTDKKTGKENRKNKKAQQQDDTSGKKGIDPVQDGAAAEKINGKEETEKRFEKLLELLEETGNADKEKTKNVVSDKPHDQILLMAAKGGKNAASNWRILDFSDRKQVREVFSSADSMGVAAKAEYKPDNRFSVESSVPEADGTKRVMSFSGSAKNVLGLYNADGSIAKSWLHPQVTEVASLTVLGGRLFTELPTVRICWDVLR